MNGRLDTSARPSHHSRPSYAASITPSFVSARSAHSRRGGDAASLTDAELAQDPAAEARFHEHEEIAEIKRYEDFTTIDWIQDAEREQQRRRTRTQEAAGFFEREGGLGWRRRVWESYDAGQAWIVVALIGVAIGLNAAFLSIITEWLSDIKLGYCTTGFYLNKSFCCWGAEEGCDEWHAWSSLTLFNYVFYICFATLFAFTAARLVKAFAPYAAGSGISEIKCIIAGFQMKGFLGGWTLFLKSIGLPLAIASGLSVGKEGPSVHYAVCTGNVISRMFEKYNRSAVKTREILSACAATGVAVAFGSPIGGVLFSLEVRISLLYTAVYTDRLIGNVKLLSSEDHVAKLFLCNDSDSSAWCNEPFSNRTTGHV
jgi:chloride channel 3/4/5